METIGFAVIDGAKSIFKSTFSGIKTLSRYEENICELQKEISCLKNKKLSIEEEVSIAKLVGNPPKQQVYEWLRKVSRFEDDVKPLLPIPGDDTNGRGSRMLQSWRVAKKLEQVKELNSTNFLNIAIESFSPSKGIEEMPVPDLVGVQAATDMKKLLEILNNGDVRRIAVWGKGGIGKTALVKNLINHLCSTYPDSFNIVIWVQVSRDLNFRTIQSQIAKRIRVKVETEDTTHSLANKILQRLKTRLEAKRCKILLILDDVWEKIDLDAVGIPSRDPSCKILLTTRSFDVCRDMSVDVPFQLNLMSDDDAWNLFVQNVGSVLSLDNGKRSPARKIVASCSGLPLAIKTLGKSLRDTPQTAIWQNTYLRWRCSSPLFKNIETEVFRPLAMSYHSLESKILQQCFLYCSLYPASFPIDVVELIQCWVSDGLINENQTVEESFNYGVALIEHLKDSCLLDQDSAPGTVKLHDVFRDLALLLSKNEELFGFHCQSSLPFNQMPKESSRRVSLIGCKITSLQHHHVCSNLTVLFLQGNPIKIIPNDFFNNVKSLRVLNLSKTHITHLPPSFLLLCELRSLFLQGCFYLTKLPSLEHLCKLMVLDLSSTPIREFPEGLPSLSCLRELNLSRTRSLKKIVSGSLSGLSSLETLDMSFSAYNWNQRLRTYQKATFDELISLDRLSVLKVRLDSVDCLAYATSWIKNLRKFDIQISPNDSNYDSNCNEKRLVLKGVDLLQENLEGLFDNTTSLNMFTCEGVTQRHWLSLSLLVSLTISNCNGIRILISQERSSQVIFPNLQHLVLDHLRNLETIVEGVLPRGICLRNLKTLHVLNCPKLKGTISYSMLRHVKKLEEIKVSGCENTCLVIELEGHTKKKMLPVLKVIEVRNMVNLRTICDGTLICPMLENIEVFHCFELKKLPLSSADSCNLKVIRGDLKWWKNLIWEKDDDKNFFQQQFQAYVWEDCSKRQKILART